MPRQSELFRAAAATKASAAHAPLAERMRPRTIDEFVGQQHLLGPGHVLRDMVESARVESLILWGPPGSGKTTLAHLLAAASGAPAVSFSAVLQGVKELRQVVDEAEHTLGSSGRSTCRSSRRPRSSARSATTRRARSTTTSSPRSSRACAAATPTRPSTG